MISAVGVLRLSVIYYRVAEDCIRIVPLGPISTNHIAEYSEEADSKILGHSQIRRGGSSVIPAGFVVLARECRELVQIIDLSQPAKHLSISKNTTASHGISQYLMERG